MKLVKKIIDVGSANIIQVFLSVILGFVVPKFLSISEYAHFKTYTLLAGYIGLFHFGFVDGLYVDYGGKDLLKIDQKQLRSELVFFTLLQFIISGIILAVSLFIKNSIILVLAVTILPYNLNMYLNRVYQSTDNLKWYSKCVVLNSMVAGLFSLLLVFVFKVDIAIPYCFATVVGYSVVLLSEYKRLAQIIGFGKIQFDLSRYWQLFKNGFIILLGNLAVNLFYGIDRWFVKLFFSVKEFSFFSFAVSMLNIVTAVLHAVSISMFSHFAKEKEKANLPKIKDIIICIGTFSSLLYFFLSIVVHLFLPSYRESLNIIAISMAIFPYMLYINAVTINLYKLRKKEKKYLTVMVLMLIIVTILDALVLTFDNYSAVAWSTLVSYIGWYYFSRFEIRTEDKITIREVLYLSTMTVTYLILSHLSNWIFGFAYLFVWLMGTLLYMLTDVKQFFRR